MIIWLTGQPGSGKTTLATEFIKHVKKDNTKIINIDGDDLRNISKNKDYSKEGRIKNISDSNIHNAFFSKQGLYLYCINCCTI